MFELFQRPQAARQLRHLHKSHHPLIKKIFEAIANLANDPRPSRSTRLVNRPEWRIRVGDFRVIYQIDDVAQTVTVVSVANRRDVYK